MRRCVLLACVCGLAWTAAAGAQNVRFVDDDASPGGDGLSWATAYTQLQAALTDAAADPNVVEIRVAAGTYTPGTDRADTFQLLDGVAVRGGYRGCPLGDCLSGDANERDIATYETILSGDIGVANDNADNSYHVVLGDGTQASAVLDGFTITAGNSNGTDQARLGAGMYTAYGSPTVLNCTFVGNVASGPFSDGAAMYNEYASPTVINCVFRDNVSARDGGAMSSNSHYPLLVNCLFVHNTAARCGGALDTYNCNMTVINCTLADNTADQGGGLYVRDGGGTTATRTVVNCIVWGNSATDGPQIFGPADVTYSCIEGTWPGLGNIAGDPLFDNDYHLTAGSPAIDAGNDDAVPADFDDLDGDGDTSESLPYDLARDARFLDDLTTGDTGVGSLPIVDMGAYEYWTDCNGNGAPDGTDIIEGASADGNANGVPDECEFLRGDVNCDGVVDWDDINPFVLAMVNPSQYVLTFASCDLLHADCSGDGVVDFGDINPFVALLLGR